MGLDIKQYLGGLLIIFTILSANLVFADSDVCDAFLETRSQKIIDTNLSKVMQKIHLLDFDLEREILNLEDQNLESIYILLKDKGWQLLPQGMVNWKANHNISEPMKRRWISNFSHRYRIEKLKEQELVIFYANYIQSVYIQLSSMIKDQKIEELGFESVNPKVKKTLALILSKYWVFDLRSSSLDPENARGVLFSDSYKNLSWSIFIEIFSLLEGQEINIENFEGVVKDFSISQSEMNILRSVYLSLKQKQPELCCKSKPGCTFCPNNLGFLNLEDGPPIPKLKF